MPAISPVLQAAGLSPIAVNPLTAAGNPPAPPVPFVPPGIFGSFPSLPDARFPYLADNYLLRDAHGNRKHDYFRGTYGGILGVNGLYGGDPLLRGKAGYRYDLLSQIEDNRLRRDDQYRKQRLEDELEEDRLR